MKTATFIVLIQTCLLSVLFPRAQAQQNASLPPANSDPPSSLSVTLDWMAHTYFFTEADLLSSKLTIHSKQTDASLTHNGCRITVEQKDVIFDTAPAGRTDTSNWKRVIDLGRLDAKSIQLRSVAEPGKPEHFALDFTTAGRYKNVEVFFAQGAEPARTDRASIPLLGGHNDYAARFERAFRRAVELCAQRTAP
jgi:hypothetical protein